MIHTSKQTDEKLEAAQAATKATDESLVPTECWFLHGAVGAASDWRSVARKLAKVGIATRAVDLWRFLECESVPMPEFGKRLNADAAGEVSRAMRRVLIGYSMGGRLALHALLEGGPWDAAVIISSNPGIRDVSAASARRSSDTVWAAQALTLSWENFIENWNAQPLLGGAIRDDREDRKLIRRRREIARSFVDWSVGSQNPLWGRLQEITVPVLWIAGQNDRKFSEITSEAANLSERFKVSFAPSSGHRVPWENEQWLVNTIVSFL